MTSRGRLVLPSRTLLAQKQHFILDFDGTLADTTAAHAEAYRRVFSEFDIQFDYRDVAGLATDAAVKRLLDAASIVLRPADVERLVVQKQAIARELLPTAVGWLDGVVDFFSWAEQSGKILSLVTSASRGTLDVALRSLQEAPVFHICLTRDDVVNGKPDPEGFLTAMQNARVTPERCIVFEDSEAGLAAARAAGLDHVRITRSVWSDIATMMEVEGQRR